MKVRDIVRGALELCGVIASNETASAADGALGLRVLNNMLNSWSAENLSLYQTNREIIEINAGMQSLTVGPTTGATLVSSRPMNIVGASYGELTKTPIYAPDTFGEDDEGTVGIDESLIPIPGALIGYDLKVDTEFPLEIIDLQKWVSLSQKSLTSNAPSYLFVKGGGTNETLNLYPVPDRTIGLVIYTQNALGSFESLDSDLNLPPSYIEAMEYNLALRLAPRFGQSVDALLFDEASRLKGILKSKNSKSPRMFSDIFAVKKFNILSGD